MRPTSDQYLMILARTVALRGTCDRKRVGCVIVSSDGRVLSTGYNGSISGAPHCDEAGHVMVDGRCIRTVHAEANAVGIAARSGTSLSCSTAYVTTHPCVECAKLLRTAGVTRVVYDEPYRGDMRCEEMAQGIIWERFEDDWRPDVRADPTVRLPGQLVVMEGIDGAGKSTVSRMVVDHLDSRLGRSVLLVQEPSGTELGDGIRAVLSVVRPRPSPTAMTYAFLSARAELFATRVAPALSDQSIVVSDRSFISSMVYQSNDDASMRRILELNKPILDEYSCWPTVILNLCAAPADALRRARAVGGQDPGGYDQDDVGKYVERQDRYVRAIEMVARACNCDVHAIQPGSMTVEQVTELCLKVLAL